MFKPSEICRCTDIIVICDVEDFIFDWSTETMLRTSDEVVKSDWLIGFAVDTSDNHIVVFSHPAIDARAIAMVADYASDVLRISSLTDINRGSLN